jgi:hypothetical protein
MISASRVSAEYVERSASIVTSRRPMDQINAVYNKYRKFTYVNWRP